MPQIVRACNLYCNGEWKLNIFSTDDAHAKSTQSEYNVKGIVTFDISEKKSIVKLINRP